MKTCPACQRQVQEMEIECPYCGVIFSKWTPRPETFPNKSVAPKKDNKWIARYKGMIYIGLVLQFIHSLLRVLLPMSLPDLFVFPLLGIVLCMIGLHGYARMKGRSGVWVLLSIIPLFGPMIGLFVLRRDSIEIPIESERSVQARKRDLTSFSVFVLVTTAVMLFQFFSFPKAAIREIHGPIPNLFPVLIITSDERNIEYHAHIIYKRDLDEFVKTNPNYSFLVPDGQWENLKNQLKSETRGYFKVEQLPDGKQSLEVGNAVHDEASVAGWYEATDKEFFPERYRLVHSMGQFSAVVMPSFTLGFLCSFLTYDSFLIYAFLKRRRQGSFALR
jgi:hypothetical protein